MALGRTAVVDSILSVFKGTNFTAPATLYVTLLTTLPSDNTGSGAVEVVNGSSANQWSGYARLAITTSTFWSAISGTSPRQISNAATATIGTVSMPGGGSIVVVGFALYDASTAGVFWGSNALTVNKTLTDGDIAAFVSGAIVLTEQ